MTEMMIVVNSAFTGQSKSSSSFQDFISFSFFFFFLTIPACSWEIRELLAEWEVQSVTVQSGSARVSLCSPEVLEDWDRNAVFTVRGQRVTIVPSLSEMLLCVGRIPLTYTEAQFNNLVSSYGEIRRAFVMISERTGDNKGYGFVEYVTKEAALQAKNALDGKRLLDCTAVCDWLDSSHITVRSLHSKCLYVDRLPPNYRDMAEFRRVFSTIVNPPYCQIALKNGCPQDWGLVEFINEDDAEKTQQNLDGYSLHGSRIRVAYYIPGVRAINLYLKLLNDGGANKGKSALLPDPPAPAVFQQLQSLAKQNPVFAQNLQSIIMQQIQDLQKGKGGGNDSGKQRQTPFQQQNKGPQFPSNNSPPNHNHNLMKNAQHTALTLLLASQMGQNNGGGMGGGSGQMSPTNGSNMSLQNQQLLAALQAMSKGGGGMGNGGGGDFGIPGNAPNLSNLLSLAQSQGGNGSLLSPGQQQQQHLDQQNPNIPHHFYPPPPPQGLLSPGGQSGGGGTPLLPSPSPSLVDVPMDTGMTSPKTPPGDLQAVWYSLFGQNPGSSSDSTPTSPGNTSPHFMKTGGGSNGSPIGRSADALFGGMNHQYKQGSSPPGFSNCHSSSSAGNMHLNHHRGVNGDLQEALSSLLNNPQSFNQIFGGGGGNHHQQQQGLDSSFSQQGGRLPPHHHQHHQQQQHPHHQYHNNPHQRQQQSYPSGLEQQVGGGMPNALLDLLMQSMKGDQQQQMQHMQQQHHGGDAFNGGMKHNNSWSSSNSNPPSPIGSNHRGGPFGGLGGGQPQRSGSNGSSEMSSPRSPSSYSPFSRNSSKGLLESGNGNLQHDATVHSSLNSPIPPPSSTWNAGGYIGAAHHQHHQQQSSFTSQSRNIWAAPSVSPGATSLNSNNNNSLLLNPLGIKRKQVHHDGGVGAGGLEIDGFLGCGGNSSSSTSTLGGINQQLHNAHLNHPHEPLPSHYADSYFKKKKKN
ncbi:Ribonucleoprotein PTB-binding 1 [Folsomia candida]|uniref:Ribonucleoprotein PTB-binding 1 n=1 Tax=Folsomia candida TaxID=158441 RepID=A0A226F0R1_FOLCA|nr:Ribonucleoprotein PTB-binding 1 [Folsomia candida]